MKRWRKILGIAFVLLLVGSLFAGCGTKNSADAGSDKAQPSNDAKQVTITWQRGKDTTSATQELKNAFEIKYPSIKINYSELPATSSEQYNTYANALAAGDDNADVITVDIVWVPEFASSEWLLPVDRYFKADGDYFEGPLSGMKFDGKMYAVPAWTDAGTLFYRKDLVPDPPKTWDELIQLSKEHIGKSNIENGMLYQDFQNEGLVCTALEFIWGNGGNVLDGNGNVVFDSAETKEAVSIMKRLIDEKIAPKGVITYKPQDCIDVFKKGKTLFMRNWPFAYARLNEEGSPVKGMIGIAPMPVGPSGSKGGATLGGWNLAINKNSKHKDEAWKLIEFITSPEGQKILAAKGNYLSIRKSTYDDEDVLAANPVYSQFKPIFEVSKPRPVSPFYPKISEHMQIKLHKVLSGTANLDDAVKAIHEEVKSLLNK